MPVSYTHLDVYKRQVYSSWEIVNVLPAIETTPFKLASRRNQNNPAFSTVSLPLRRSGRAISSNRF